MQYKNGRAENVKIAYIGGGSRGWAWGLMSDLAIEPRLSGHMDLYDIDWEAAKANEIIGNQVNHVPGCESQWSYRAVETIGEALTGADFVIISILPGTFDEMEIDVHMPEQYGIYQSVGDTTGPGGIVRALRTVPMFEEIARRIQEYAPNAWVINYTNPMSACIDTLYRVFPGIKDFGCCHEIFGTQNILSMALADVKGIEGVSREEIKTTVVGVNHFTWMTAAKYQDLDLYQIYGEFGERYHETGFQSTKEENWMNKHFLCRERVKLNLFRRYGVIAAAGDRHLSEFCPGDWFLRDPQQVREWQFGLTPVSWRKEDLKRRLERSARLSSGQEAFEMKGTGEDGVKLMCALLGLGDRISNVNIPNRGQIPNLPLGTVVETNAAFTTDTLQPLMAGNVPESIYPLVSHAAGETDAVVTAAMERDLEKARYAFAYDPLVRLSFAESRRLFEQMVEATGEYLQDYHQ